MEVLVSVIILAMSMAVVFYVLQGVQGTQCVSELKSSTLALQNAMLDVALGSPPTTRKVAYKMPSCGGKSVEALRFSYYANPAFCRACPGAFGGCWLIEPTVYDFKQDKLYRLADAITCVNMPSDVELKIDSDNQKCLSDRLTTNFCPAFQPGTPGERLQTCSAEFAGVAPQLFYTNSPPVGQDGSVQVRSMTFVKSPGERVFSFQLVKESGAGLTSVVKVCPLRNP